MTTETEQTYTLTTGLNVLKHLGLGLYSNVPAVLSEAIANAWDADATHVDIEISKANSSITIQDDGHGMSVSDANRKYLHVGYERRKDAGGATTPSGRPVMGRKGIGKLSLFSIAKKVEVHTVREGERHGFKMDIDKIQEKIEQATNQTVEVDYHPDVVNSESITIDKGTKIILTDLKREISRTSGALTRRLARRFSVIGATHGFTIKLNDNPITIEDRGYYDKLQYIWTFGALGEEAASAAKKLEYTTKLSGIVDVGTGETNRVIDGWIGTVNKPGDLKDRDTGESINGIVIMVRGKLAQENILDEFGDENLYSEYVIGEIHADFLDKDDEEDIATTSRQKLIEEDPRYQALKQTLGEHLKTVQNGWRNRRDTGGTEVATTIPQIKDWYESLNPDHRKNAERLFGRINQLSIRDDNEKRRILIGGILAFESLRFRNLLTRLDNISTENLGALAEIFERLDDLEQSAYYQIIRDRIEVIRMLTDLVDDNAKERALQEHLYKHLWLLDPSWERATHTELMEKRIYIALNGVYESLSEEEKQSRLDIYYTTTGNKHVIIELKRADRILRTPELYNQIQNYYSAALQSLRATGRENDPLEIICVLGRRPSDWDNIPGGEQRYRNSLASFNARIVMYDELIQNALVAYQDYVDRAYEAGRVYQLIRSIEDEDLSAMHPDE